MILTIEEMKQREDQKNGGLYEVRSRGLRIPHILDVVIDYVWDRCDKPTTPTNQSRDIPGEIFCKYKEYYLTMGHEKTDARFPFFEDRVTQSNSNNQTTGSISVTFSYSIKLGLDVFPR